MITVSINRAIVPKSQITLSFIHNCAPFLLLPNHNKLYPTLLEEVVVVIVVEAVAVVLSGNKLSPSR